MAASIDDTYIAAAADAAVAQATQGRKLPWHGQWLKADGGRGGKDVGSLVELVPAGKQRSFFFPRELLVNSCEYFADALSGEWAETQGGQTGGETATAGEESGEADAVTAQLANLAVEDQDAAASVSPTPIPTLHFREDAQTIHDLLTHIHPRRKLLLRPHSVEPLVRLADMIGLEGLKAECEAFLMTHSRLRWDPIGMLKMAEELRLKRLYTEAGKRVLAQYPTHGLDDWVCLSDATVAKLLRWREEFFDTVAKVAVYDITGRLSGCCHWCHQCRAQKDHGMRRVVQSAMSIKTNQVSTFLNAVKHTDTCPPRTEVDILYKGIDLDVPARATSASNLLAPSADIGVDARLMIAARSFDSKMPGVHVSKTIIKLLASI